MLVRENTAGHVQHPETILDPLGKPRRIWAAPEVEEVMGLVHNGDPASGWEGDERYALYLNENKQWELWRLEADGEMRLTVQSKPGKKLDRSLILFLLEHDTRRHDVARRIMRETEQWHEDREREADERIEAVNDKLAWALRKDLGHLEGSSRGPISLAPVREDAPFWKPKP